MAFNGSGTFDRLYNWVTDRDNNVKILASKMDQEMDGFATGLSNCITRNGESTIISNLSLNNYKLTGLANGSSRTDSINIGQVQDGTYTYLGLTGGVADAYTLAPSAIITSYAVTQRFTVKIHATNTTTTPYLQISAIANPTTNAVIKKLSVTKEEINVAIGDLIANGVYSFQRNSANDAWIVLELSNLATSNIQGIAYLTNPISWNNNIADANNDIDFTIGVIDHDNGSGQSLSTTALTKQLDATFVAGNNQGGLDTGTKANSTWYQIFAISNNTTYAVDYLFSTSRTSPTIPSGWTKRRWLGAIRTNSSGNIDQNYFARRTPYGQIVSFIETNVVTGAGAIPYDDTIPQNNEGAQYMELAINPILASSKLLINVIWSGSVNGAYDNTLALFKDSIVNALKACQWNTNGINVSRNVPLFACENSGSTSLQTFKVRAGATSSISLAMNGISNSSARLYGGVASSSIVIQEIL